MQNVNSTSQTRSLPWWRLGLPLLLQLIIILVVPAQAMLTYFTGRAVILQTAPVDPYDFLRGYSQVLNYEISTVENLQKLPGWNTIPKEDRYMSTYPRQGTPIYVILAAPEAARDRATPMPWKPVRVSAKVPKNLPDHQSVIRGIIINYSWVDYGIGNYYMPEDQREQINQEISEIQRQFSDDPPFVVEVKTRDDGNVVAVSLWVGDRHYRF